MSSLDADSAPAEGLLLQTTAAVLVGVHESSRGGAGRRVFGHVFSCAFSAPIYALYEAGLAKAALQSLQPVAA